MRIAAVDLVSNTCFPALAAYELGYFKAEGVDVEIELVSAIGSTKALKERRGRCDDRGLGVRCRSPSSLRTGRAPKYASRCRRERPGS